MLTSIIWEANRIAFTVPILGRDIAWYSLLFISGLWLAYFNFKKVFSLENINIEYAQKLWLYGAIWALIGARLGEIIFYDPQKYIDDTSKIIRVWEGGLSSHGGTFALIVLVWWFGTKVMQKSFLWLGDRIVSGIAIGAACVRFGNLMNSEIIGTPTSLPWGFVFKVHDNIARHPVVLYEGIVYVILSIFLYFTFVKNYKTMKDGYIGALFLVGMFGTRFFLEFMKENNSTLTENFPLTMGQVLSLPLCLFGIYILISRTVRQRSL